MLTVIIYRKSSQQFIDEYRSLFAVYCDAGEIAFCFWDEHGTDIASALPQLASVVHGVRNWRAIVVLPSEENVHMEGMEVRDNNPFDFLCNSEEEPVVEESSIPLIRLAQMLGGVPPVNHHYESEMLQNKYHLKQIESDEYLNEQKKRWDELNDKYNFISERPSSLYLLAARSSQKNMQLTLESGNRRYENTESRFWYRNRYPARVRFLVQDCSKRGTAHYQEDLFGFWMTALTLALNDMPTGVLEAYKLYSVESSINWEKLHQLFSAYYNRLDRVRAMAVRQVMELQKSIQFTREMDELPYYQVQIPVMFSYSEQNKLYIDTKGITLAGDCPVEEEPWFHVAVKESRKDVKKIYRTVQVALDRACIDARISTKVMDEEIHEMDEYQFKEMAEDLSEQEKEILNFNTYAVLPLKQYRKEFNAMEKSAATSMKKRMYRKTIIAVFSCIFLAFLVAYIPDIVYQLMEGGQVLPLLGISLLGCIILGLVSFCCLMHFKIVIIMKIADYNGITSKVINKLMETKKNFSNYLSGMSSYMRGRYILQKLERKTMSSNQEITRLSEHIDHLDVQMTVISNWLKGFERKPLLDMGEGEQVYFDFEIPPEKNREYFLRLDEDLKIEGSDGRKVKVPYPFIENIEIVREQIYESSALYVQKDLETQKE